MARGVRGSWARVVGTTRLAGSLAPLRRVLPFLKPYRGRIVIGILALVVSSAATLALPQFAARADRPRLTAHEAQYLSHYYHRLLIAGGCLGLRSATRFYFVTWLGERVVADIRKAVFDNVLGLTPHSLK